MVAPPASAAMSVSAPSTVALRDLRKSEFIEYLFKLLPLHRERWVAAVAILGPPPLWILNPVEQIVRRAPPKLQRDERVLFRLEHEDFTARSALSASCGDKELSPRGHEKSRLRSPPCWQRPKLFIMVC